MGRLSREREDFLVDEFLQGHISLAEMVLDGIINEPLPLPEKDLIRVPR